MPSAVFSVSFLLSTGGRCATGLKTYMARTDEWVIDSASARSCTAICTEVGKTCTSASETIMTDAAASASALQTALGKQLSTFCPGGVPSSNPTDDVPFLWAPGNFCEHGRDGYSSRCETVPGHSGIRRICYCQDEAASATGDPHLRNIHGQAFDLMEPGRHTLLLLPRGVGSNNSLLQVEASAHRVGTHCGDMYFEELSITGAWVESQWSGGLHFRADADGEEDSKWMSFGKVDLKVAHGRTQQGTAYLNFYVKHLAHTGLAVGGLLGEDDHVDAATPSVECRRVMDLHATGNSDGLARSASIAEASME